MCISGPVLVLLAGAVARAAAAADRARASAESASDSEADPPPRTGAAQATSMAELIELIRSGRPVEPLPAEVEADPLFE
jgi:hypothetical protein